MSTASVSTHVLDTSIGRPAQGVPVSLSAYGSAEWKALGASATDPDGRCTDLPALPEGTTHVRLTFDTAAHLSAHRDDSAFFPEVTVTFAVVPGEHYHVPLLLNPFGYSVYRGS